MTINPEQFNLLATKDELNDAKEEIKEEIKGEINKVLFAVDAITKKFDNHNIEHISNQAAHDRFEARICKLEKQINIATT